MRAVVQRVSRACVRVGDEVTGSIESGLLVLLGVGVDDEREDVRAIGGKVAALRIFFGGPDEPLGAGCERQHLVGFAIHLTR